MSTSAIIMMVVSITTVWGGLALAIWNINSRSPEDTTPD